MIKNGLKRNVSTVLLLTPLELSYHVLDYHGFVEAFIADIDREDLNNSVICLFKLENMKEFESYLNNDIESNPNFIEDYDYNGFVAVAFKFPEKYLSDYEKIKKGKYSAVSADFKALFKEKITAKDEFNGKEFEKQSLPYRIINRYNYFISDMEKYLDVEEGSLLDKEIWKAFDLEKETLDISKYENITNKVLIET